MLIKRKSTTFSLQQTIEGEPYGSFMKEYNNYQSNISYDSQLHDIYYPDHDSDVEDYKANIIHTNK